MNRRQLLQLLDLSLTEKAEFAVPPVPLCLGGGEPRRAAYSGIKALMLAVLEDGIRCFSSPVEYHREQAEAWVFIHHNRSPFAFTTICEVLGLSPEAVRDRLRDQTRMRFAPELIRGRSRPNARRPSALSDGPQRRRVRSGLPKDPRRQ